MLLSFVLSQIVTGLKISPDPCFTTIYMYKLTAFAGFVSTRSSTFFASYMTTSLRTGALLEMLLGPYKYYVIGNH